MQQAEQDEQGSETCAGHDDGCAQPTAVDHFAAADGMPDAENATGATALYERVGMRVVNRWDLWERSSSDGAT